MEEIRPVIYKTLLWVGGTLFSGFILLILHFSAQGKKRKAEIGNDIDRAGQGTSESERESEQHVERLATLEAGVKEAEKKIKRVKGFEKRANKYIVAVSEQLEASQGLLYLTKKEKDGRFAEMVSGYAFSLAESEKIRYEFGEGLVGQVAREGKVMNIRDIPEGYIKVISGLGSASPTHLLIVPIKHNEEVIAVVELAAFRAFSDESEELIKQAFNLLEKDLPGQNKRKTAEQKSKATAKTPAK